MNILKQFIDDSLLLDPELTHRSCHLLPWKSILPWCCNEFSARSRLNLQIRAGVGIGGVSVESLNSCWRRANRLLQGGDGSVIKIGHNSWRKNRLRLNSWHLLHLSFQSDLKGPPQKTLLNGNQSTKKTARRTAFTNQSQRDETNHDWYTLPTYDIDITSIRPKLFQRDPMLWLACDSSCGIGIRISKTA